VHVFELPFGQAIDFKRCAGEAVARYREMGATQAELLEADSVALGSRGQGAWSESLLGSTTPPPAER